jgi:hypothetical protein
MMTFGSSSIRFDKLCPKDQEAKAALRRMGKSLKRAQEAEVRRMRGAAQHYACGVFACGHRIIGNFHERLDEVLHCAGSRRGNGPAIYSLLWHTLILGLRFPLVCARVLISEIGGKSSTAVVR